MPSPESSFGASDARGHRYIAQDFFKGVLQFTLTGAASRPATTRDQDDDLQSWDVSAAAPTLGSLTRQAVLNNNPVAIARIIAALNSTNRSLVAHASACDAPVACALEPWAFAVDGGRVVHNRIFLCHDPATGTSYEALAITTEGRGQEWLV